MIDFHVVRAAASEWGEMHRVVDRCHSSMASSVVLIYVKAINGT